MTARALLSPDQQEQTRGVPVPQPDWRRAMYFPIRGTVLAVYPLDDPLNHAHVTFCDIQLWGGYPIIQKVFVARAGFHQETKVAGQAGARDRNAYEPWAENGTNGWAQTPLPGDIVVVQFFEGHFQQPFIAQHWPAGNQGRANDGHPHGGGYPFNQQSRFRVTEGQLVEEVTKRLDATAAQMPQWTWLYNGAFLEILNDGSLLLQSSVNRTPFIPKDVPAVGLVKSPTPTGNLVVSTRGAPQGDLVVTTGKSAQLDVGSVRGNVLVLLYDAKQGNFIVNAQSEEGHIIGQASKKSASQIFLRAKSADDYLHVRDGLAEVSGGTQAVFRSKLVSLGSRDADKHAMTYEEFVEVFDELFGMIDVHVHLDVQSGSDESGPPAVPLQPVFDELAPTFMSNVVMLELDHKDTTAKEPAVSIDRVGAA